MIMLLAGSLDAAARPFERDTVFFYDTWEQMLDMEPSSMVVSPGIECETPYAVDIYTRSDDYRLYDHMAACMDGGMWLISSSYLKQNFKGDVRHLGNYKFMPVFFNEKIAYFAYVGYRDNLSVKDQTNNSGFGFRLGFGIYFE